MAKDPLSFLDSEVTSSTDPLSFLDKENAIEQDPLSFLDSEIESENPKEPTWFDRAKSYFTEDKFGEALSMQMKSGGPAGAPALSPKQAARVGTELATIAATEAAFAPIVGAAAASKIAPNVLSALARLTQAGTTGAAVATTTKLVEEGEFPSQEELIEQGATWMAIDAAMQSLHLGATGGKLAYDFGSAVNKIAKEDKIPATQVLKKLWDATKGYVKTKFGRSIEAPQDITPADVELLIDKTKLAEEKGLQDIDITPEKPKVPEEKVSEIPKEVVEKPVEKEIKNTFPENKPEYANGKQIIYPAGTIGDYIKSPEVRESLKDILDYPIRVVDQKFRSKAVYFPGQPINIIKEHYGANQNVHSILHEAIHVLQDMKNRLPNKPARGEDAWKHPSEMSAEKFRKWAFQKETNYLKSLKNKGETWSYPKLKEEPEKPSSIKQLKPKKEKPLKAEKFFHAKTQPRQPMMGKGQAVARSKIIKLFRTAFKDPIRLGKISQRKAQGIHKMWARVSRLLKDNDVEVAAHEIGHNLHTILYGGKALTPRMQRANVIHALRPYLNELKQLGGYAPFELEGFAEFTRLYVTNPNIAQQLAPNFYVKFEADLNSQFPELKNALLEARDYYDQYLQGSPESRIRAQTQYGSDKGRLENIIESIKKKFSADTLKTQFLDDVYPAKRLVAEAFGIPTTDVENLKDPLNLYRSLRVLKGAIGKGDVFLLHETFNALTLDKVNGSLRDILVKLPNEEAYREFNDYLIARRVLEKGQQKIETGISFADAFNTESKFRKKYNALAKELDHYNDTLLNYAKDAGMLSDKQYQDIKKNNLMYTPFQRVMEPEKKGVVGTSGNIQAKNPIKRMKGSTRDIVAPVESIIKNTYAIIINAEKNLSAQVLAKLASEKPGIGAYVEAIPTPIKLKGKVEGEQVARELAKEFEKAGLSDLIEYDANGKVKLRQDIADSVPEVFLRFGAGRYPAGQNIITVYIKGKPKYYEVSPEIFEMWTKGIEPYTANLLTKILRIPARTLRAGAVLNPKFMLKNFVRDTWGSWLFSKYGKSIKDPAGVLIDSLYSPLAMISVAAKKGPLYVEWMKSGGGMSTMQGLDRDNVTKKLDEVRHGHNPLNVMHWLRTVAGISEESNRLNEFAKALDVEGKTRHGKEIAAFAARDLSIDFAKMGLQTKALNQIISFFNATIQGGDKLLRALASPEDRNKLLPHIIGYIIIPSLILAWLNKDDERVDEFYEEEKDFNFITFIGDKALKIPVPFETGVISHGLMRRMFNYFMKKDPEAFEGFMGSILSAMLPNLYPTLEKPIIETIANKNFFTGSRIIPASQERLISKYQYKNTTSSTARLLGRAMAYMLGPDTRSKAASPAIIDHFITSWTGGLGRLMINISDASLEASGLSDKVAGPERSIIEKLGLDAFILRYPRASTRSIEKFYDNYQDATARQTSLKYATKMDIGSEEDIEKGYERFDKIYDYRTLQQAYKAMQACQKEINNIWNDPLITPELKKQYIDDLYLSQIEFAKTANEDIKKYRLINK